MAVKNIAAEVEVPDIMTFGDCLDRARLAHMEAAKLRLKAEEQEAFADRWLELARRKRK